MREVVVHAVVQLDALSGYKVPKSVRVTLDPLPVSPAGKILKWTLREQWSTTREIR